METDEDKMVRMNMMIEHEHHEKLVLANQSTRISKSELVRIALHLLWTSLGDVKNPDPEALAGVLKIAREAGKHPPKMRKVEDRKIAAREAYKLKSKTKDYQSLKDTIFGRESKDRSTRKKKKK